VQGWECDPGPENEMGEESFWGLWERNLFFHKEDHIRDYLIFTSGNCHVWTLHLKLAQRIN
jgi:hypothetical protein